MLFFRAFMLLSLYAASAHGQAHVVGYRSSTAADPIRVLILFGKFPGETHSSGVLLENFAQLDRYIFTGRDNTTANTKLKSAALVDPAIDVLANIDRTKGFERPFNRRIAAC